MAQKESSDTQIIGFLLAIASLIMTAIFPIFGKIDRVKRCNLNPMVFNIYFQCGVLLFCIITTIIVTLIAPLTIHFSYMGLTSGILLGIGSWFIWLSLTYMGIAHTSAIASGIASITGFIEGTAIGNYPDHIILSVFSLVLICIGILGIGFNESLTSFVIKRFFCQTDSNDLIEVLTPNVAFNNYNDVAYNAPQLLFRFSSNPYLNEEDTEITPLTAVNGVSVELESDQDMDDSTSEIIETSTTVSKPIRLRLIGMVFSFLGGICFGSLAFPEQFVQSDATEVYFLPSFGVGVLLMIIVDCTVLSFRFNDQQLWHLQACFVPGLASGLVWCVGFLCILYAELLIDYSMAIPIRECSICVAVLIGIFGFKEIVDSRAIVVTLICVCVVLVGCFLLPVGVE